jgi:bifunctional UDP-N-acetylglucosamine pyrophosphorylase/glucosamine-1-phosphate N-acetyltransferase
MKSNLLALVWAGGKKTAPGLTRLSVDHLFLGKSALRLAVDAAGSLKPERILAASAGQAETAGPSSDFPGVYFLSPILRPGVLGAVVSARKIFARYIESAIIVLDARRFLFSPLTLRALWKEHRREKNALTILSARGEQPACVLSVRDLLEASAGRRKRSSPWVDDLCRTMTRNNKKVGYHRLKPPEDALLLKTPADVAKAAHWLRESKARELEAGGVVVLDPSSTWIDLDVRVGRGTVIYPAVVIEGRSVLGKACRVFPFVHLIDSQIGHRVKILSSTVIEGSTLEDDAQVGPFTHFRPGTKLRSRARVGNFVELKNTVFGERSKAGHLSYLGDAVVGPDVNIGAGTITCNFDGIKKNQTIIERGAFIGSGTELIAPVKIGKKAYVGAGSTITKDVSPESLAVARTRQVERPGWARRRIKK